MIRFLCLNAFIAVHTILFSLWGLLLSPFDKKGRLVHFYTAVPWAKGILWACGIKVRPRGQERIDPQTPRIYMTNHQSYFDIFALLAYLPVDFKFIVKQELMKIPLFGAAMRRAGYIGIARGDPRKAIKSMNEAAEKIRNGTSVVMFPEGTRSADGRLQVFKRGGFNLAIRSGCDIVPVAIVDSHLIVPKGSLRINRGSFDIHFGDPISVKEHTRKTANQLMDQVRQAMEGLMEEVHRERDRGLTSRAGDPAGERGGK
jgi:1-acyl-sn-glycerol-3-phosphate acyltransferase